MKTVLAFLLALVASSSFAAAVPLTPGPGIAGTASGFTTASTFTGQFSAAAFNSNFTTQVAGKAVTMPASMRMAANAGQFAAAAIRLNPAALLGSAVAAWLLQEGLKYVDGQWQKETPGTSVPAYYPPPEGLNSCGGVFPSLGVYCRWAYQNGQYTIMAGVDTATKNTLVSQGWSWTNNNGSWHQVMSPWLRPGASCPANTTYNNGYCVGQAQLKPSTQSDWDAVANSPLPDAAAGELAGKGVPLPLDVPHIAPQDIPLSDPYDDPVTGKRYRDRARITPSSDGKTADVQTYKQEVDEAGNPKKQEDGQTDKPPEEQTDFCKKNPDAIACMPEGQTDDQELQTKNIGSGISPISVGGQGQCMADKTLSMATMGKSITFTYKPICDLASMVRPLILALAWLLAGWIMVGAVKDN